jgi:ketosteroid isomerase-like protein
MVTPALQDAKEALESLDRGRILSVYRDTFLFEDPPSGERITERPALEAYFQSLFALPNIAFTDVNVLEAPTFAVIEWTWSGTSRSSGKRYQVKGASVVELKGGKIARETLYYDPRAAFSQETADKPLAAV